MIAGKEQGARKQGNESSVEDATYLRTNTSCISDENDAQSDGTTSTASTQQMSPRSDKLKKVVESFSCSSASYDLHCLAEKYSNCNHDDNLKQESPSECQTSPNLSGQTSFYKLQRTSTERKIFPSFSDSSSEAVDKYATTSNAVINDFSLQLESSTNLSLDEKDDLVDYEDDGEIEDGEKVSEKRELLEKLLLEEDNDDDNSGCVDSIISPSMADKVTLKQISHNTTYPEINNHKHEALAERASNDFQNGLVDVPTNNYVNGANEEYIYDQDILENKTSYVSSEEDDAYSDADDEEKNFIGETSDKEMGCEVLIHSSEKVAAKDENRRKSPEKVEVSPPPPPPPRATPKKTLTKRPSASKLNSNSKVKPSQQQIKSDRPSEFDKALTEGLSSNSKGGHKGSSVFPPLSPLSKSSALHASNLPETQNTSKVEDRRMSDKPGDITSEPGDQKRSQKGDKAGTLHINDQDLDASSQLFVLPSGRPVSPRISSAPQASVSIMNPDPLQHIIMKQSHQQGQYLQDGVLATHVGTAPNVLPSIRDKIESMTLFDADMMRLAEDVGNGRESTLSEEEKDSLRRSFQQSISASVLVSLAHKRYERRRLAAMEIEKVVRSLVQQHNVSGQDGGPMERVRAILLMLSEDYIRSTNEDARKGGVVALAACAIGLKKGDERDNSIVEGKELILASVVHACQDNSSRVRYYATESLFNVIKVLPLLAVQHFFILLEILRSLCADVDNDVRSGAELLDKKLKEVIVGAINTGSLTPDACVPMFARFVHIRHKPTKKLAIGWLQEFSDKLIGAPLLQFLHLFLVDIFAVVADPNSSMRQVALQFLNSTLTKILMTNEDFEDSESSNKVNFDKILLSLVSTMEHPDPLVRKVAMYWMSRIVSTFMNDEQGNSNTTTDHKINIVTTSVRNTLPYVLPGILLSIGDTFQMRPASKDAFLPDQTTQSLAEQTNKYVQNAVKANGETYVPLLEGFIVALQEELDTPGGLGGKNPPALERKPYRLDVKSDGSGIESPGWFRSSEVNDQRPPINELSCVCALNWLVVLYDYVVPDLLREEYAREFIAPIIRLIDRAPESITFICLEVLAKITVPKELESEIKLNKSNDLEQVASVLPDSPMTEASATFALGVLNSDEINLMSRNRDVFRALISLHAHNSNLFPGLFKIICHMCTLQPAEFVFVSFALELHRFVSKKLPRMADLNAPKFDVSTRVKQTDSKLARDLEFVSNFVQVMIHVLLNSNEACSLRNVLKNCIACQAYKAMNERRAQLFHILFNIFGHNVVAAVSLCLWAGAFRTASIFIHHINPLDVNLVFYLQLDQLIEYIERPIFRHLHLLLLQYDDDPHQEGSSAMLYRLLKSILMLLPQSTSYSILKDRLLSIARFYQSTSCLRGATNVEIQGTKTEIFVSNLIQIRNIHCDVRWRSIRAASFESAPMDSSYSCVDVDKGRREWLGYLSEEEERLARKQYQETLQEKQAIDKENNSYHEFDVVQSRQGDDIETEETTVERSFIDSDGNELSGTGILTEDWKKFWTQPTTTS